MVRLRARGNVATAVGAVVLAASLSACWIGGPGESRITVHNRTETPVVFASYRSDHYVAACTTVVLTWHGDWASDVPENAVIPDAVRMPPITNGPFESNIENWYVVTSTGRASFYRESDVPHPLPACEGAYVEPTPIPLPTPAPTPAPIEYPIQLVGLVVDVQDDNRITTYTLADGTTIVVTPNSRYLGGRHPEVGDLLVGGSQPERWIDRAAKGQQPPGSTDTCYALVGDAMSIGTHVVVGRSGGRSPIVIVVDKAAAWADPDGTGFDGRLPGTTTCLDADGKAFANR